MMASLYKRATPSQHRILRIVEGAVKNASDAHGVPVDARFTRSVAKRAAGTLTAQWPDVLAAKPSEKPAIKGTDDWRVREVATCSLWQPPARDTRSHSRRAGKSHLALASPLTGLWKRLSMQIRPLKEGGQIERAAAYVEVLKMIAALQREEPPRVATYRRGV